jgi:putative FmdB family regulatory protein
MPIYEYKCNECKQKFEAIVTSSLIENVKCPQCKTANIKKIISAGSYRINRGNATPAGALSGCAARGGFS